MSNNYLEQLKVMYHQEDENRLFKKYDIEAGNHRYTQRLAYYLWEKAGKPDNMSDHFWFEAENINYINVCEELNDLFKSLKIEKVMNRCLNKIRYYDEFPTIIH